MPELPEVETVRRGLQPFMEGATVVRVEQNRPDLRFAFPENFAERLSGRRIEALGRRAKYLTVHLDDGLSIISHLGMSGSFRIEAEDAQGLPGGFHHERSKNSLHDLWSFTSCARTVRLHALFIMIRAASVSCSLPKRARWRNIRS
ncbi:hypothetical protein DK68_2001 [Brucella suis]|nr:Formamidopyrimidine-DNA glycosylase [Brucella suis bv. 2]ENR23770.1 formamidopyrimidine-DNA glycosylase [Brucella suis 92/63]ENR26223.1 formamidopyrimidine-DNA glycosylase [Brucella suis 94/11]ENR34738.1 formamidopyrimidine-DNA glycosylase [Brucella suis F5/03-2]ENR35410.1 formamidopyrimidine-DNA glycosylase [Brucella suis F4/06-146]ENR41159.1 formamidopyrimidine-DNA glycosylase [Brucella suis F8/06-2]ENT33446.1 formamidopyrimidine-DNA glycosylase [Brucella suis 63/261]ENT39953.1 formamid